MKIEDRMRDVMKRAATNGEPPVAGAWERFELRARRAQRVRRAQRFAYAAAGAAALVAAAIVLPQVLPDGRGDVTDRGTASPSPSATPTLSPTADWLGYAHPTDGWGLKYPRGWVVGRFEGGTEFRPVGLPGLPEGGETFGVEVEVIEAAYDEDGKGTRGAREDGRMFLRTESPGEGDGVTVNYRIDWTERASCPTGAPCPHPMPMTLRATVYAGTSALRDRYMAMGELVVESIAYTGPRAGNDAAALALRSFMDSRIFGQGAEEHLSAQAKRAYESNDGGLQLYSPTSNPHYAAWEMVSRTTSGARDVTFIVRLLETYTGSGTSGEVFESIRMGPGQNALGEERDAVVLTARRCANAECS